MTKILLNLLSLSSLLAVITTNASATSTTTSAVDGIVEIEKQKLVKFPDDADQQQRREEPSTKEKHDEAQRILEQIEKINQSLGYVKKQPEQPKLPPILDSSQYLFPKPAYQPFHAQSHQISGSNGEILLVPSIRAVKFDRSYKRKVGPFSQLINYNLPPQRRTPAAATTGTASTTAVTQPLTASSSITPITTITSSSQAPITIADNKKSTKTNANRHSSSSVSFAKPQYYFRPNQVHVPAPQTDNEQQQLPTHFVIPVRLYKLNKEEYMQKFAPQEYRVKGYKIVGDIDNFYGKAKAPAKHKGGKPTKKNSTPKYHLFFLPRELVLNEDSTFNYTQQQQAGQEAANNNDSDKPAAQDMGSREEKLTNRPFKVQTSASTGSNGTSSSTQIVRKRIVPKPLRNKETNINSLATQQLSDGSTATSATTIHITPPPPPSVAQTSAPTGNINTGIINVPPTSHTNKNTFNLLSNRPSLSAFLSNSLRPNNNADSSNSQQPQQQQLVNVDTTATAAAANNATAANAIKMAFQNFFKLPFRPQDAKPVAVAGSDISQHTNLESVPLQIPQKTFFGSQSMLPQPFYHSEPVQIPLAQHHHSSSAESSSNQYENDYKWDEESSNSAGEEDGISHEESEKQIFGHRHKQQQETQKEAIKSGGIIIQRLKVRKGGIAIAGPGGVATAGSGGTAIVGPGGLALTHPRSLTIAGPGAKIIAIPANVDLKDALLRTNLDSKSFPREGKIVATGPTVYYSPATGTATEEE